MSSFLFKSYLITVLIFPPKILKTWMNIMDLYWEAIINGLWQNCRYHGCEPLVLSCPSCSGSFDCPAIFSSICKSIKEKPTRPQADETSFNFWHGLQCPKCPEDGDVGKLSPAMIANQVLNHIKSPFRMWWSLVMGLIVQKLCAFWICKQNFSVHLGWPCTYIFQVKRQADGFVSMYYRALMMVSYLS